MLKKNCQKTVSLLMTDEDYNVRITVAKNATPLSRFTPTSIIEGIWKEYIRDSIGYYANICIELHVKILAASNGKVESYMAILSGDEIINHFWDKIHYADGIRIIITQNNKHLSWIIVRS
ncbi:MAG: hypothetical protein PHD15_02390 [Clostridia bacterium]|nr:hypothetical protein [Clostridia bacterium]MDD4386595.1 hypothetical protein [Clostridia bacterium]